MTGSALPVSRGGAVWRYGGKEGLQCGSGFAWLAIKPTETQPEYHAHGQPDRDYD